MPDGARTSDQIADALPARSEDRTGSLGVSAASGGSGAAKPRRRSLFSRLVPRASGSTAFTAIRNRFVAINLPLILIASLGLYGISEWMVSSFSHLALKEELHKVSSQIARSVTPQVAQDNRQQIQNVLTGAAANSDLRGIEIRNRKGKVIARIGKTDAAGPAGLRHRVPLIDRSTGKPVKVGSVVVSLTDAQLVAATDARRQIVAIIALCLAMVAVVIGMVVQESTIRTPLKRLIEAIRRREQTGEKVLVDWKSSDEPGQVIEAFNELQEREEMYLEALRRAHDTLEKKVEERTAELATARDEARAAVAARDAFMAKLSHELRTPLNAIIGFSEMMECGMVGKADPTVSDYGRDINRSGRHLLNLIEDLLDLSRIEIGQHSLDEREVPIARIVDKCVQMVRSDATTRNQKLVVGAVPDDIIFADEVKLTQVLINLLANAVKYTPRGGQIEILCDRGTAGLAIYVTDNGPGISEKDQETMFEPFRQGDDARRNGIAGAGLGLSLARSFIELHGGKLRVFSKVGQGTCMSVFLPRVRIVGPAAKEPADAGAPGTPEAPEASKTRETAAADGAARAAAPSLDEATV